MTPADLELADELAKFYADPLGYVMFCFPWNTDPTIQMVELPEAYRERFPNSQFGPDVWACEFLDDLGRQIKERKFDGRHSVDAIRYSTASGHGIGKSTLVAWLVKFILDTRPLSVGTVTANTAEQLKTKTWAEVGKWHHMSLTSHWFDYSNGRGSMSLVYRDRKLKWRADGQTCREENSESFAGQHAPGGSSFYIFDEASNIPDKIFEVREGGLTDGEPMVFDFGNPTRNTGMFYENCVGRFKHRYSVRCIDSRTVAVASRNNQHKQWIEDYGIDSDFVKVRVLGQFPSLGTKQFIPVEWVQDAQKRLLISDKTAPLVIGVDVSRFGEDETVLYPRMGNDARSFPSRRYRGLDGTQVADRVVQMVNDFRAIGKEVAAIFIDHGGLGASPYDALRRLGYAPIGVNFGGAPTEKQVYRFKLDEMAGRMRLAIKETLCLPDMTQPNGADLFKELTQREYDYAQGSNKIQLESKKSMKERGLDSPNLWDALALTFAQDVAPAMAQFGNPSPNMIWTTNRGDYDPLEEKI